MSEMIGMDVEAVRRIARELSAQARRLDAVQGQVGRLVQQGGANWLGANSQGFSRSWQQDHLPKLRDLVHKLDELAAKANTNADEQSAASDGGGSPSGGWVVSGELNEHPLTGSPTDPFAEAKKDKDTGKFVGSDYYTGGNAGLAEKGLQGDDDISLSKIKELSEGDLDLASISANWDGAGFSANTEGEVDLGNGVTASGAASATILAASAAATGSMAFKDGVLTASGKAGVEGDLVKAEVSGKLGNDQASLTGTATGVIGGKAEASGSISADGVKGQAGGSVFAGVQASATAQVDVGGVKPSVTGEVYAGIGAHAEVGVEVTASHVKASVDVGAALGVGAGISFDVDIDVAEVSKTISSWFHW